jgi:hypothetical protein
MGHLLSDAHKRVSYPLVRLLDERIAFPFNVVRIPLWNDAARVEQAIVWNRRLYDRIRGAGGVQYPVGAAPMASKPSDVTIRTTPVTICLSNNGRAAAGLL